MAAHWWLLLLLRLALALRQTAPGRCYVDVRHDPLVIREDTMRSLPTPQVCNEFNLTLELPTRYNGTALLARLLRSGKTIVHELPLNTVQYGQSRDSTVVELFSPEHALLCADIRSSFDFETEPNANIYMQIELVATKLDRVLARCELLFRISVINVNEKPRIIERVAIDGVLQNEPQTTVDCDGGGLNRVLQFVAIDSDRIGNPIAVIADERDNEYAKVTFSFAVGHVSLNATVNKQHVSASLAPNHTVLQAARSALLQQLSPLSGVVTLNAQKVCSYVEMALFTLHATPFRFDVLANLTIQIVVNATDSGKPPLSDSRAFNILVCTTGKMPFSNSEEARAESAADKPYLALLTAALCLIAFSVLAASATYWCKCRSNDTASNDSSPLRQQTPSVVIKNENHNHNHSASHNLLPNPNGFLQNANTNTNTCASRCAYPNGSLKTNTTNCSIMANRHCLRKATILNRGNSLKQVTIREPEQLELDAFLSSLPKSSNDSRNRYLAPHNCGSNLSVASPYALETFSRADSATL